MQLTEQFRKQILIVEDEGLIAADIRRRLERLGYTVPAVVHSGEEAVQIAKSSPFDLVLMDIRLAGEMDGIATAQALRTRHELPVVFLTAHSDHDTIHRAKLTEPFGYVIKPIADGDLRSAVEIAIYKHEIERRLRTSEAWLSATLRSIGDGVIATNTSGEVAFMNPVAEQLTGWPEIEARGRQLMDVLGLYDESAAKPAKNPVYDLFAGETRAYTLLARTGGRTPVVMGCFENHSQDELLGAILVLRDIAARRHLEARLTQAQRMEAVANLAGGLAHDFNNQLTIILGYAEELASRLTNADRDDVAEIQRAASLAGSLTRELVTLSRREAAHPQALNVNEVVCEMQAIVSHSLGKQRMLATSLGSPAGFVRADCNQLKQMFLNLALYARDVMPAGGELRIETSTREIEPGSPDGRLFRPGSYSQLLVSISGAALDSKMVSRIFEPAFGSKEAGLRTELGLSLAHSIVAQNGGYISANSGSVGTRFEILLPSIGTFETLGEPAPAQTGVQTVLLVEDEDGIRRLMRNCLQREGYQLLEARNAQDAEALALVCRQPIDILVTDVVMPGLSGHQLAERIQQFRPRIKTLLVSGYRHNAPELGSADGLSVLSKPFVASELLRRVRLLLGPPGVAN